MRQPDFITFTGLDAWTNLDQAEEIGSRYPVEWGVLFSTTRAGVEPRYPAPQLVDKFRMRGMRLAAHLCGGYARRALLDQEPEELCQQLRGFGRVQVNYTPNSTHWPELSSNTGQPLGFAEADRFADRVGRPVILQSRGTRGWPSTTGMTPCGREYIYFLYDLSGGRGKAPAKWPPHPGGERLHGYAGGIGPHNAAEVVGKIDSAGPFWLDMEGGVRDAQDRLDLEKVRAVCAAVYGD